MKSIGRVWLIINKRDSWILYESLSFFFLYEMNSFKKKKRKKNLGLTFFLMTIMTNIGWESERVKGERSRWRRIVTIWRNIEIVPLLLLLLFMMMPVISVSASFFFLYPSLSLLFFYDKTFFLFFLKWKNLKKCCHINLYASQTQTHNWN